MKATNAHQFFKAYFSATHHTGGWLMRYFSAAQRDDMLDGVMQWRYTVPAISRKNNHKS